MTKNHITESTPICKNCLTTLDGAANFKSKRGPKEGDLCLCVYCKTLGMYEKNLSIRPLLQEEIMDIKKQNPMMYESILQHKKMLDFIKK